VRAKAIIYNIEVYKLFFDQEPYLLKEGGHSVRVEDQIIEFYSPLVTRRILVESDRETVTPEKKFFCSACEQEISEETFNEYNSYCPDCYEFWESEEI